MTVDSDSILQEAEQLRTAFKTLLMATVDSQGLPEASYTPYIWQADRFYIFVSGLSAHTANLRQQGQASVLFVEDERGARNLFARKRLNYQCHALAIGREDARWETLLDAFRAELGPTVDMLRTLPDFVLFELTPVQGNFVKGFGQAYRLTGQGLQQVVQATGK